VKLKPFRLWQRFSAEKKAGKLEKENTSTKMRLSPSLLLHTPVQKLQHSHLYLNLDFSTLKPKYTGRLHILQFSYPSIQRHVLSLMQGQRKKCLKNTSQPMADL